MRIECIERLLEKNGRFPQGEELPRKERYATWPHQADLICKGDFEGLRAWQLEQLRLENPHAGDRAAEQRRRSHVDRFYALSIAMLLGLAFISFYLAKVHHWCVSVCPPCPPPPVQHFRHEFPSDQLFGYNKIRLEGEHRVIAEQTLADYFGAFTEVQKLQIFAHTDPIASANYNRKLAEGRADEIKNVLGDVEKALKDRTTFDSITINPNRQPEHRDYDSSVWDECFRKYNIGEKPRLSAAERPLTDLPDGMSDGRMPCSEAAARPNQSSAEFPACGPAKIPVRGASRAANVRTANIAKHFLDLVECLAPMRHVIIDFWGREREGPENVKGVTSARNGVAK